MDISEINRLHQRVFQCARKLPGHELWNGTLSEAVHILANKLGGGTHLSRIIAEKNNYTGEQRQKLGNQIKQSDYGIYDNEILQMIVDVWESLDEKPKNKRRLQIKEKKLDIKLSKLLSMSVRHMDQYRSWNGSYDEALSLLRKFVASGISLAHELKEQGLIEDEQIFKGRFQVPFSRNALPAPEILELACVGWESLLKKNRFNLNPDRPYQKANDLVQRLKGSENWNSKKPLKAALAVLAKELGSYRVLSSIMRKHKNYTEEEVKDFKCIATGFIAQGIPPHKIEADLALELWELILDNPEITKRIKTGLVDLDKEYSDATALVRRQLGMRNWNGTLFEALSNLKRLSSIHAAAEMLNLPKDQEQRIQGFLNRDDARNPREEDLQCMLRAWGVILDRRARGITGPELTAPVRRRRSDRAVGSALNGASSNASQHCTPNAEYVPEPVG